jgi:hypothetical protein
MFWERVDWSGVKLRSRSLTATLACASIVFDVFCKWQATPISSPHRPQQQHPLLKKTSKSSLAITSRQEAVTMKKDAAECPSCTTVATPISSPHHPQQHRPLPKNSGSSLAKTCRQETVTIKKDAADCPGCATLTSASSRHSCSGGVSFGFMPFDVKITPP